MSVTTEATAIRPFTIDVPEEDLQDLRARIAATRWPEKETVSDETQGVQLRTVQALARQWAMHDWRDVEARLNALPQFIAEIDRLRREERPDPGRGQRVPGRDLRRATDLAGTCVPEAPLLQPPSGWRAHRGVGAARDAHGRLAHGVPFAPLGGFRSPSDRKD